MKKKTKIIISTFFIRNSFLERKETELEILENPTLDKSHIFWHQEKIAITFF